MQTLRYTEQDLFTAITQQNTENVERILSTNLQLIYVPVPDNQLEWSMLHLIACLGYDNIMHVVLSCFRGHGQTIDFYHKDKHGWTPMHLAIARGHKPVLESLIGAGAIVDAMTSLNETLAYFAVRYRQHNIFEYLRSRGANFSLETSYRKSIVDIADDTFDTLPAITTDIQPSNKPLPKIIFFEGGGVKGIAYYGAMKTLIERRRIALEAVEIVSGTSAGAITALLLSLGYSVNELGHILNTLNFNELLDDPHREWFFNLKERVNNFRDWRQLVRAILDERAAKIIDDTVTRFQKGVSPIQEIFRISDTLSEIKHLYGSYTRELKPYIECITAEKGLFSGERLLKKFREWIRNRGLDENLTFAELKNLTLQHPGQYKNLYVIAYNNQEGKSVVFSHENAGNVIIADAVRCSMSIPGFFVPHGHYEKINGSRTRISEKGEYYDGACTANYYLSYFDKVKYAYDTSTGLELLPHHKITNPYSMGLRLLDSVKWAYYEKGEQRSSQINQENDLFSFLFSISAALGSFTVQEDRYQHNFDEIERTVHIDTLMISSIDFDLDETKKDELIKQGKFGARFFLHRERRQTTIANLATNTATQFAGTNAQQRTYAASGYRR